MPRRDATLRLCMAVTRMLISEGEQYCEVNGSLALLVLADAALLWKGRGSPPAGPALSSSGAPKASRFSL
jgi:hypothetical protein